MAEVSKITPKVRQLECPTELRELKGWLLWKSEQFDGEPKPRKVPYYVDGARRHGKQGSPEDRNKLTTFDVARDTAARRGYDGVGLAMFADWGVTALDFDHCVDEQQNIPKEVLDVVTRTFAEYSPSGKGVRAFVKGALGNHKSHKSAEHDFGMEVFSSSGFVTFTGDQLPFTEALGLENTIADVDEHLTKLCLKRFGTTRSDTSSDDFLDNFEPTLNLKPDEINAYLSDLDPSMGRDPWIQVGMALSHETNNSDTGFQLWDEWSALGSQYPGTDSLRSQWDSFARRDIAGRQITMRTVVKMSREARGKRGEQPRSFDLIARVAEEMGAPTPDPNRMESSPGFTGKYRAVSAATFAERPPIRWLIKGVLPRDAEIAVLYGAPGSGKSFQALDMGIALARGVPWRERKVVTGRVLYVAAEGGAGVAQRIKAYSLYNNVDMSNIPFAVVNDAPNLMIEEDASELVKTIIDAGGADLIVCDTWAQVTPGANENSGEDMGLALKHARAIRAATGAMILLVAHTGKDQAKGIRGWSGMNAAANTSLEVSRIEDSDVRILQVTKQKDGRDDLPPWAFKLEEVLIGFDEDDEEIMTPVVIETETPTMAPKGAEKEPPKGLELVEKIVLDYVPMAPSAEMTFLEFCEGVQQSLPMGTERLNKMVLDRVVVTVARRKDAPYVIANGKIAFTPSA